MTRKRQPNKRTAKKTGAGVGARAGAALGALAARAADGGARLGVRAARAGARLSAEGARRAWASYRFRQGLSVAAFGALVVLASMHVREEVRADRRYRVSKASLAATAPPPGLTRTAIDDLARLPFPGRSFSLYEDTSVARIAGSFERLPWVRRVRGIGIEFPARLRFDLVVRRPAAGLKHQGALFLLDSDGMVLPARCYAPNDPTSLRLPVITGADIGRRRVREGELLEHVPVRHGLAVSLALRAQRFDGLWAEPVTIDVTNVDGRRDPRRSEIVVTAGDTRIEWGRSPASGRLSIPVAQKIDRLRGLLDREPNLARLSLIRLQFDVLETEPRR